MKRIEVGMLTKARDAVLLSWSLSAQTLKARYRKSFLGYFWLVAPAMIVSGGASVAHSAGLLRTEDSQLSYPLFVFIGAVLWQSFADSSMLAHRAVEGARSYITRVHFPREALILGQVYEALFVFLVRIAVVVGLLSFFTPLSVKGACAIFACNLVALALGLGISMIIMPFTLLFSDLERSLKLALSYGLFLTPAMYEPVRGTLVATVISLNPISPLITAARDAAIGRSVSDPESVLLVVVVAFVSLFLGLFLVRVSTPIVVERMLTGGK
jgi:lipopolysaccharide transport system permease protein